MPLYDYECPRCHTRFEKVAKMTEEFALCTQEGCEGTAKRDEVPQIRHFDKLGPDANYSSVRFNFNFID